MSGEDIRKLLGGYATGTLSADEQKALFEAALHDEKLFAALADEHALREMLEDFGNRAALLRALAPQARGWGWRWMVPMGIAVGLVVITSVIFVFQRPASRSTFETAKVVPNVAPNGVPIVVRPALQPEVQVAQRASAPESSTERRQVMERAPAAVSRRDVREEARPVALSTPFRDVPAPATAPPAPAAMELRSAKKDSAEVKSETGIVADSGSAGRLATTQGLPGKVQYTILKRGADGQFKPVDAGSTIQPADAVRLNIEADEAGFLSVSQKEPAKMLFQGAVRKQVPVTIPATGWLDLSNRGALRIMFSQPGVAGAMQNALPPGSSLSKSKAVAEVGSKDQTPGVITVDVNLNVATPAQQQQK